MFPNCGGLWETNKNRIQGLKSNDVLKCGEQLLEVTAISTRQERDDSQHVGIIHHNNCVNEIIRNGSHFCDDGIKSNKCNAILVMTLEKKGNVPHSIANERQHTEKDAENKRDDGKGYDSHFLFVLHPFDLHAYQCLSIGYIGKRGKLEELLQPFRIAQQLDDHGALQYREESVVSYIQSLSR